MKVDKIYHDYNENKKYNRFNGTSSSVSFAKAPSDLSKKITEALPGNWAIKFMKNLEWLKGEIGGILITAVGTGLVAPFPIAYNPFVKAPKGASEEEKKDVENTKKYTAMRQPISAILAILFQVSALKPIDKFLDIIFNKPEYAEKIFLHCDQSVINSKSYVEKLAKKEIKEKYPNVSKKEFENLVETRIKQIENEQIEAVAKKFQESGKIHIGKRTLDNKSVAELINSQIDDYIKDATKLKYDNEALAFYSERARTLLENEAHIKEIFKDVPKDKTKTSEYLKNILSKEKDPKIQKLIKEILERPVEIQQSRISRTLSRIQIIKNMCGGEYSYQKYLDAMTTRNAKLDNIITEFRLAKIMDPKSASDDLIKKTIEKISETCHFDKSNKLMNTILHDTDTFKFDKADISKKVHKDISKLYKDFVRNNYKGINQIIKIVIGVFITLPITCNALNWVYPRIMDKFFPELAGSKKAMKKREA